jgi:TonB family protein
MMTLLDAGARCDLDQKSAIDLMELAFRYDMPEAVKLALDQCLDPTFKFYDRYPSTWAADYYDAEEILELLISKGAKRDKGESLNIASPKELLEGPEAKETTPIYYPDDLKRKHGSLRLLLKVLINEEGKLLFPKMIDSDIPEIDKIVMETVTKWRFTVPKRMTGKPCSVITKIPIVLTCEENEKDLWQLQIVDKPPKYLKRTQPKIPSEMKGNFRQGYVQLALIVDEEGRPSDIKIISLTHEGFAETAIEAVKKWTFQPAYYQGKPVKCSVSFRVFFGTQ